MNKQHSSEEKQQLPTTLGTFVWGYLKNKKLYLFWFFVVSVVWAVEMSLSPYLLKTILDKVIQFSDNNEELISALLVPVVLYVSMSVILNLNFRLYEYANLRLYPELKANITRDMFSYLIDHSHLFFQNNFSGSLTKKILDMVTSIELMIQIVNGSFYPRIFALIISSFTLFIVVHPIFSIILIIWALIFVYSSYLVSKKLEKHSEDLSEANVKVSGKISDSISNVMSVKLFSAAPFELAQINSEIQQVIDIDRKLHWQNLKINFFQGISVTLLTFFMLASLIYGRIQGWVTVGDFVLVLTLSISFLVGIHNMGQQIQQFAKMKGVAKQALSIITTPHEILDLPGAKEINIKKGLIEFKDVKFCYDMKQNLFSDLNIKLKAGEKIGIVGPSGGGKSTFFKLILRLVDLQVGSILIDHQDIKNVTRDSLLKQLTIIPQEPDLFHRTIIENIKIARPDALEEEVIIASKKAKCHEFICELSEGYESVVGERGVKLSGGQKQRIAIARAFLKNTPILLLDEATSALDSVTESYIQQSLRDLMINKTTIVIAHRLSTLKNMDRILVFDNGKIIEDGSLESLLKNINGLFYKLWHMQLVGLIDS